MAFIHSIKVPRLYKAATKVLMEVKNGGNIKALINQINHPNKRGVMALVIKTLQHKNLINKIFDRTEVLQRENNLNSDLAAILVTELLWGKKGLQGDSKPVQTILKYQEVLVESLNSEGFEETKNLTQTTWRPRYVRVNTLKQSVDAVIQYFIKRTWKLLSVPDDYPAYLEHIKLNLKEGYFIRDYHMQDVILFPYGTVFAKNVFFKNGSFLLQDKSSCMVTYILAPEPGSTVLDMCAAPGMKTSHLAAYMKNQGKIYAVDHDKLRFKTLLETIKRCNLKCVTSYRTNVLNLRNVQYSDIDYIVLDPSCSGTGMLSRLDYDKTEISNSRLNRLSSLQSKLLSHALTMFPSVKRVVYSTCSLNAEENEKVIEEALLHTTEFKLINCSLFFKQWLSLGLPQYNCGKYCIRSVPDRDCMNGFFIAAFERIIT